MCLSSGPASEFNPDKVEHRRVDPRPEPELPIAKLSSMTEEFPVLAKTTKTLGLFIGVVTFYLVGIHHFGHHGNPFDQQCLASSWLHSLLKLPSYTRGPKVEAGES